MNNKKGFTLIELLASLAIIALLFIIAVHLFKGTYSSSMTQIDNINDNQIFSSAKMYALETNAFKNKDYACITLKELVDYGYLRNIDSTNRPIKVIRNNQTKVIEEIIYVNTCE